MNQNLWLSLNILEKESINNTVALTKPKNKTASTLYYLQEKPSIYFLTSEMPQVTLPFYNKSVRQAQYGNKHAGMVLVKI